MINKEDVIAISKAALPILTTALLICKWVSERELATTSQGTDLETF
jgi:hypothetical protein